MANLQQVGIEFVTQGEKELVSAIARVDKSQKSLESTSTSLEKAVRRGIATEEQAISAFVAVSKSAVSYQDVLKGLEQDAKMMAQANQANVNSILGVDKAHKSARESAKAFGGVLKAMEQDAKMLADANQANINSLLGVDRAAKSARDSANAMKAALDEQERASRESAAANQEAINGLFGIGRAAKSAEKSAKAFGDIFKAMDQDAKMADQAMQEYNNALLGVDRAHKSARDSANAMKAAFEEQEREAKQLAIAQDEVSATSREAAAAAEALQREKDQLKSKYDSVYAASQLYERSLNELDRALELGAVSATQHRVEIDKLNAEYQQFASGAQIAASASNRFAQQDQRMRGGLNNTNVMLQQAGFQVGDFAVQVQSVTNVLVAFGQQATQIVGTMAALAKSTRMIALFSGLGIAIPIITAIGQAFMRTRGAAETFEDELQNLENTTSSLKEVQDILSMSTEELGKKFGDAGQSVREYAKVEAELQSALARSEMSNALEQLDGLIEKYGEAFVVVSEFGESLDISGNLRAIERDFGLVGNEAQRLQRAFSAIMNAETFESQRQAVNNLLSATDDLSISMSDMSKPVAEMLLQFFKANRQIEESEAIIKALEDGLNGAADAAEETNQALARQVTHQMQIATIQKDVNAGVEEILATRDAELQRLEAQTRINNLILQHGKDSEQVTAARLELERQVYRAKQIENDITGNNLKLVMAAYDAYIESQQAVNGIGDSMGGVNDKTSEFARRMEAAANAVQGIKRTIDSIGLSNVALEAEVRALEAGRTEAEAKAAGRIAAERERLAPALQSPLSSVREEALRELDEAREGILRGVSLAERRGAILESRRDAGGGGGAAQEQEDYLRQLQREADIKLRMIGLSEREQRKLEIENDLKQKGLPIEEKRIEQVLRAEQALRRAQQAEQRRQEIVNTVSSNIESALMSVVDGTKSVEDAFRGMLRNIILEIYKQQVAQPFAQQAGNFLSNLFFANGGVFKQGSVTPFANGGVVGGPTYFPMRNGSTGLMGEAGPEAIMPLKRTKGGKLGVVAEGAGGDINQTLVFNISANGDESVKRIVRDEAPRIAEQAKSAVVDAKRRGGSYGRAFR